MSFLFNSVFCIFLVIIIWSRKKKGNRCDLKRINYNKVNSNFFLSVSKVLSAQGYLSRGYLSQGVYVLGSKCPGGKCPGGICPRG